MSEIDVIRERLKEYRELLEVCYQYIKNPTPTNKQLILDVLEEHGIGQ